jgi:hypothetical protein
MGSTKQLAREEWKTYFDRFTAERLQDDTPEAATVEIVSPRLGDQVEFTDVRLLGLAYVPKTEAFQVLLENVDHLVFHPTEIWVLEGDDDALTIEVVGADGGKEIIYVHRSGPPAHRYGSTPDVSSQR